MHPKKYVMRLVVLVLVSVFAISILGSCSEDEPPPVFLDTGLDGWIYDYGNNTGYDGMSMGQDGMMGADALTPSSSNTGMSGNLKVQARRVDEGWRLEY